MWNIYIMNNLYQRMLLKQHLEQEQYEKQAHKKHYEQYKHKEYYKNNYEKQKQRAREYYWKNRESLSSLSLGQSELLS